MTGPLNPFADLEWRAMHLQLLIGVQYAIYEVAGMAMILAVSLLFMKDWSYAFIAPAVVMGLTCLKHVWRLEKLSHRLQDQHDKLDAYDLD